MGAMIEVEGLTKLYGDFAAVSDLSFQVRPGELLGLVGPNGAGKSTLIQAILGILPRQSGEIRLLGHPLGARGELPAASGAMAWNGLRVSASDAFAGTPPQQLE